MVMVRKGGVYFLLAAAPEKSTGEWYIGSEASHHMISDDKLFVKGFERPCQEIEVRTENGSKLKSSEVGTIMLSVRMVHKCRRFRIANVLLTPGIAANTRLCSITFRGERAKLPRIMGNNSCSECRRRTVRKMFRQGQVEI